MSAVQPQSREMLSQAPVTYFKAVDAKDLDGILGHFASDATLTVQTDHVTFTGSDEIRRMFRDFTGAWDSIVHRVTRLVVDADEGRASTEQNAVLKGSTTSEPDADMYNCNFFEFDETGKFSRVIIWMDGVNPLQ